MDRGLRKAKTCHPPPAQPFIPGDPPDRADVMGVVSRGGAAETAAPREGAGARCEVHGHSVCIRCPRATASLGRYC